LSLPLNFTILNPSTITIKTKVKVYFVNQQRR
jgi:hypothetical protein